MLNRPVRNAYTPPWGSIDRAARARRLRAFLVRWGFRAFAIGVFVVAAWFSR